MLSTMPENTDKCTQFFYMHFTIRKTYLSCRDSNPHLIKKPELGSRALDHSSMTCQLNSLYPPTAFFAGTEGARQSPSVLAVKTPNSAGSRHSRTRSEGALSLSQPLPPIKVPLNNDLEGSRPGTTGSVGSSIHRRGKNGLID